MAGVNVPLVSVQHQYLITEPIEGRDARSPDPARSRPPDLLQGGGRRPGDGWLRTQSQALGREGNSARLQLLVARLRPGPFRAAHEAGPGACAGARASGRQGADQRPGILLPPTETSFSARRPSGALSMSAPASTPSASRAAAAPERCWPSGSSAARRRWTSGRSTFAASAARILRSTGYASGHWSSTASTTRSPGRTKSTRPGGPTASRRSTPPSRRRAPASARSSDGSAPTGSRATV